MKIYKRLTEDQISNKEFYNALFTYVGANIPLDIKKYAKYLKPFIKKITCYRFWQEFSGDEGEEYILLLRDSFKVQRRDYYACTKSFRAIKDIIEEFDADPFSLISEHKGKVIDIIECMKDIIKKDPNSYYKDIYRQFSFQQEVLYIDHIRELDIENIISYVDQRGEVMPL